MTPVGNVPPANVLPSGGTIRRNGHVTTTLIDQRHETGSDRKDILARLMEARNPDTGESLEKLNSKKKHGVTS